MPASNEHAIEAAALAALLDDLLTEDGRLPPATSPLGMSFRAELWSIQRRLADLADALAAQSLVLGAVFGAIAWEVYLASV